MVEPRTWAVFVGRVLLGLIFLMAGIWKVFELGPVEHARRLFVEPYAASFLPPWSLWTAGVTVPVVELVCGALLVLGLLRLPALMGLGCVLILVTFGHLVAEPLYPFNQHVFPRAALLILVLLLLDDDRISLDRWREGKGVVA